MVKLVKESLFESLTLSDGDFNLILKKLEYTYKSKNGEIIQKLKNKEQLSDDELTKLIKKFEYTFRKSDPDIIKRIKDHLGLETSNIAYSNLKAKQKRDQKNKDKE